MPVEEVWYIKIILKSSRNNQILANFKKFSSLFSLFRCLSFLWSYQFFDQLLLSTPDLVRKLEKVFSQNLRRGSFIETVRNLFIHFYFGLFLKSSFFRELVKRNRVIWWSTIISFLIQTGKKKVFSTANIR